MTVKDVKEILGARVLTGEEFLDRAVRSACGSDMRLCWHFPKIIRCFSPACATPR